eukprot:TRINITY_DN17163_c0_g1_i1.p1 TRINITY_DN17163_c0_g1~~TRINITY_DN17163_c0_g1_i1.p1  ORF type:complete len:208 (+),score=26.62 TRINITY_DN17163_c0_g1_i1:48-626(+)
MAVSSGAAPGSVSVHNNSFDHMKSSSHDYSGPLLTAEEEMQYQRALWVNRLLKEQLAAQTQGLSIKEIEEAQGQIQARMRDSARMEAWNSNQGPQRIPGQAGNLYSAGQARKFGPASPRSRSQHSSSVPPQRHITNGEVNRRREKQRIRQDNFSILARLESVKSTFTPRVKDPMSIPKLPPRSRLLGAAGRD